MHLALALNFFVIYILPVPVVGYEPLIIGFRVVCHATVLGCVCNQLLVLHAKVTSGCKFLTSTQTVSYVGKKFYSTEPGSIVLVELL